MSIRNLIESAIKGDALAFNESFETVMNESAVDAVEEFKDPTTANEVVDILIGLGVLTAEEVEAEEFTEETLLELSKKTLGSYVKNAKASIVGASIGIGMGVGKAPDPKEQKKNQKTFTKRNAGIDKAVNRLTKEETEVTEEAIQIDELSRKTLGSYIKKASNDSAHALIKHGENKKDANSPHSAKIVKKLHNDNIRKINKRQAGIGKATDKLTKD